MNSSHAYILIGTCL